jgi:hypothetical protein
MTNVADISGLSIQFSLRFFSCFFLKSMILFDRNLKLIALRIRQAKSEDTKAVTRSNN